MDLDFCLFTPFSEFVASTDSCYCSRKFGVDGRRIRGKKIDKLMISHPKLSLKREET